jgi:hypothetical protein
MAKRAEPRSAHDRVTVRGLVEVHAVP